MKKVLSVIFSAVIMISILFTAGTTAFAASDYVSVSGIIDYSMAAEVVDIVNRERAKVGAAPLEIDEELTEAAMYRALETSVLFSHTRPNGEDCFSVSSKMHGENIAMASGSIYDSPEEVMEAWMNSDGHRENILRDYFVSIGVGCFYADGIYYWTQAFGAYPASGNPITQGQYYAQADIEVAVTSKPTSPNGYNVYARGDGGTDLYLEWNKVSGADGYRVYIISGDKEILKGTATTNRFTFTDLVPSWEYRVMVVAFNEYGTSASKTTVCAAPAQVKNVKANASGNRITASWSSTTSHGYLIQWSKNSNFSTVAGSAEISGSDKTSYTINVNSAQDYYVRVRAWKNYAGSKVYGDFSTPSRAAAKPGAPNGYNVYARGDGGTDLYLEWNKVSNADGYRVYIISGDKEILKGTTNSNRFTFTDLVPSWEYRVMVVAFNENGSASSKTTVCAAPSQVKNVKANASGNRITASWSSTTSHGYLIQWSTSSNFSTVAGSAVISGSGKTNYTINVSNAKNYYVRVRAWKNFNGSTVYGDFSKPAAVE